MWKRKGYSDRSRQPTVLSTKRFELAIRQVMMYYMGYVRNEKGMATALERLHFIEGYLDKMQASDFHSLMRANEAVAPSQDLPARDQSFDGAEGKWARHLQKE